MSAFRDRNARLAWTMVAVVGGMLALSYAADRYGPPDEGEPTAGETRPDHHYQPGGPEGVTPRTGERTAPSE